ncbi:MULTISPECIES: PhzF family phenazine biosynthesis protein [unclassified Haladaptatus]|uniref:PhzF family phenazine biosynthesis protein n=1 Tax=unclassified Haladaptatus TaxID=2622732 RepID=UPI0023E8CDC7|nr:MULTISPECIES: PhzF family phenazine biosynthesis protein [unclassified Haladaptatus]
METRRALLVDAFTDEPLSGNAAGLVPDADGLSAAQMQAVAREFNASETAFLLSTGSADRRIRYFTPRQEVDLCGHATIASHAFLHEAGAIDPGTHTLETNVGVLDIDVEEDGTIWMTQSQPEIREVDVDYETVAEALGIDPAGLTDIEDELPLARATTGLPFLVVPVTFLEHLSNAEPDMAKIEELSERVDTAGIYAFTFDALDAHSTLHGRMFAPRAGVPEDPVTGTASGATGAYLRHFGAFDSMPDEMVFEQGHFVERPGGVRVRVGDQIRVGGRAITVFDGSLVVPALDEDEILEA